MPEEKRITSKRVSLNRIFPDDLQTHLVTNIVVQN